MINNNPTTQEHKQNIKDFLTGTADLIFENQEKMTNGDYVELNRMMAEITIVNNRTVSHTIDSEVVLRQFRQDTQRDARMNTLEHRNSVLRASETLLTSRVQQLNRENEQLKQRLENIHNIAYPQSTQTQPQQPVVQETRPNHRFNQTETAPSVRYTRNRNGGDTRRIQETDGRRLYEYIQNPETLRYVKRNGRSGVIIERVCKENIEATVYAPTLKLVVGRMTSLNGHFSDDEIREHTEIVHFVRLTPQGGRTSRGEGTDRHFLYEYQVF